MVTRAMLANSIYNRLIRPPINHGIQHPSNYAHTYGKNNTIDKHAKNLLSQHREQICLGFDRVKQEEEGLVLVADLLISQLTQPWYLVVCQLCAFSLGKVVCGHFSCVSAFYSFTTRYICSTVGQFF